MAVPDDRTIDPTRELRDRLDRDGDGVSDGDEARAGTNPDDPYDTPVDLDKVDFAKPEPDVAKPDDVANKEFWEQHYDREVHPDGKVTITPKDHYERPTGINELPDTVGNMRRTDSDGDGLSDWDEYERHTNPNNADTDHDGRSDKDELDQGFDPTTPTPPNATRDDQDGDGIGDGQEQLLGQNWAIDARAAAGFGSDRQAPQMWYEARKTGDPVADAWLRKEAGEGAHELTGEKQVGPPVEPSAEEIDKLADKLADDLFDPDPIVRGRADDVLSNFDPAKTDPKVQAERDQASRDRIEKGIEQGLASNDPADALAALRQLELMGQGDSDTAKALNEHASKLVLERQQQLLENPTIEGLIGLSRQLQLQGVDPNDLGYIDDAIAKLAAEKEAQQPTTPTPDPSAGPAPGTPGAPAPGVTPTPAPGATPANAGGTPEGTLLPGAQPGGQPPQPGVPAVPGLGGEPVGVPGATPPGTIPVPGSVPSVPGAPGVPSRSGDPTTVLPGGTAPGLPGTTPATPGLPGAPGAPGGTGVAGVPGMPGAPGGSPATGGPGPSMGGPGAGGAGTGASGAPNTPGGAGDHGGRTPTGPGADGPALREPGAPRDPIGNAGGGVGGGPAGATPGAPAGASPAGGGNSEPSWGAAADNLGRGGSTPSPDPITAGGSRGDAPQGTPGGIGPLGTNNHGIPAGTAPSPQQPSTSPRNDPLDDNVDFEATEYPAGNPLSWPSITGTPAGPAASNRPANETGPSAGTSGDSNPNAGSTDDDSDNDTDDDTDDNDTDDEQVDDTGDSGEAVARRDDDPAGNSGFGTSGSSKFDASTTTASGTVVDERLTNTGNPKHRPEGPDTSDPSTIDVSDDPDAGEPRTDDDSGAHGGTPPPNDGAGGGVRTDGGGGGGGISDRTQVHTTGTNSAPLDPETTNTGNPNNPTPRPTADPSTLPPDTGTGTDRPTGSGYYTGITPDQTGDGADLSQGLGISRGPTVNLGEDDGPDLRGIRIGDDSPLRAVATGDAVISAQSWSTGREATVNLDNTRGDVDPTRFEIQDLMSQGVVEGDGGEEFEIPELPWDADPTGVPGLDRPGVDVLGLTAPGAPGGQNPTVDSITSSLPTIGGPGRDGDLPFTVPGGSRPVVPGKDAPLFERGFVERPDTSPGGPEPQQPEANDDPDPYEVKEPSTIDVEPGDDDADDGRRDDDSGAYFEIGHPDTSELDMFEVSGGAVFDVRITNTGNPGLRPQGPSFDPSTLPPDDGTRGRATGDEDEMEDLDIQRRTVDDDQGGPFEVGHADTSELDMFEVSGGAVFDVRTTNTGNPGLRPEGPSFDPSTLQPDDGTRGRDTGDEDEMDDLDIQRRTVDDDQGTPGTGGGGSYSVMTPDQFGGGPDLSQGLGLDRGLSVNLGDSGGFDASAAVAGATDLSHLQVSAPELAAAAFEPTPDIADPPVFDFADDIDTGFIVSDAGPQNWFHGSTVDAADDLAVDDGPVSPGDDMFGP